MHNEMFVRYYSSHCPHAICVDVYVCFVENRCSHGFCHACLEVFIRNQSDKLHADQSKYAIHKTIAAIKAGNVSGGKASSASTTPLPDPYTSFACPICQHDDDEHGRKGRSTTSAGTQLPFFRSENLDSIIYLCQQASSFADREVSIDVKVSISI